MGGELTVKQCQMSKEGSENIINPEDSEEIKRGDVSEAGLWQAMSGQF